MIEQPSNTYRLFPDDKIFVKPLNYKNESILILGETGQQTMVPIDANKRPTLSDAIFSGNVLNKLPQILARYMF